MRCHHRRSYAGRFILAVILLGATFGVSPVLGWLVLALAAVVIVVLLVRYLMPGRPAKVKPARAAKTAEWRADHVPASAEYRRAHPEGPRDWTPAS
jgi:uncharacterized membrane protein